MGGDDDSSDDDDDDLLQGLARPQLNAAVSTGDAKEDELDSDNDDNGDASAGPVVPQVAATAAGAGARASKDGEQPGAEADRGDEDSDEAEGGLLGAEAAFAAGGGPMAEFELDPFRVARGADVPGPASASHSADGKKGNTSSKSGSTIPKKLFVGGLSQNTTDASLVRFFARYGKVQEATVAGGSAGGVGGSSRGFGFVTFVSDKGARYCIQQAGDPPMLLIDGSECTVRYAQQQNDHGARLHKMPARGNVDYLGLSKRGGSGGLGGAGTSGMTAAASSTAPIPVGDPGVAMIAAAHKRGADAPRSSAAAAAAADADGAECGGARKKQKKKEIVTVSRRQDAEPLDQRPITMREIFPKEFWRI